MRLPRTSHQPVEPLQELPLGLGEYVAGSSRSLPFLSLDGARRRRPLVFGQVTDDLGCYPALAAGMFSGRQSDPCEWAVMWRELGADGVWVDLRGEDASLVRRIASRCRIPVAVTADHTVLEELSGFGDAGTMILIGRDSPYTGPVGDHAVLIPGRSADEISDLCLGAGSRTVIGIGFDGPGEGLGTGVRLAREIRERALSGVAELGHPILADVTGCWNRGFPDARAASMWEAETALAAMLAGADIVMVRGPGAADMTRVYGEELADL